MSTVKNCLKVVTKSVATFFLQRPSQDVTSAVCLNQGEKSYVENV